VTRHDAPTSPVGELIVALPGEPSPEPAPGLTDQIAGEVAVDVARQLAEPVRALRDRLGLVVDHLERHVATATGPTPYPWRSLQALRQDLGAAYLEATTLARRLDELDRALGDDAPGWFELAAAVELGLHIAGHHLTAGIEVLIDLRNTPPVRGVPGAIALLVAQLVTLSAGSARDLPGSTVSVRVSSDAGGALVTIADNGAGSPRAVAQRAGAVGRHDRCDLGGRGRLRVRASPGDLGERSCAALTARLSRATRSVCAIIGSVKPDLRDLLIRSRGGLRQALRGLVPGLQPDGPCRPCWSSTS